MIRYKFYIKSYWKVIVYYNIDYNFFNIIANELISNNIKQSTINNVYNTMRKNKAKAVTISNNRKHISIVLFNKHTSKLDYIDSIVHESEHIKQHVLKVYNVADKDEAPAYTIGYIARNMFRLLDKIM